MAKALYRKYRPTRLSDVIGQEQITNTLAKSLEQGKISHAYLFVGPRGTGKTSVARIFAHEINKFKYEVEDDYVDIIEIDGASNRGIDDIRELREKALIAPTTGKYKIYIIDEVHMLTREAFNALLKTLEEPPKHVVFIMATTDFYKVPVTITSRAQTYTFKLADNNTMFNFLKNVADKEKIKIDDNALEIIVKRGGGSFRDSLSLLDQISTLSTEKITKEIVTSAMGLPEDEQISALLSEYEKGDVVKITTLIKKLLSSGIKPETLAEEIINQIIINPQPKLFPLLSKLPEVKAPFPEAKLLIAFAPPSIAPTISQAPPPSRSESHSSKHQNTPSPEPPVIQNTNSKFNQDSFIESFNDINDTIYLQLKKSEIIIKNHELHIYPKAKIAETILNAKNNKTVLNKHSDGMNIIIHEVGEANKNQPKDQRIGKISDIMGGEVINYGGKNPF